MLHKYSCMLVEDEPLAQALIQKLLEQYPNFILTARCKSAFQALKVLQDTHIDVVFLDIHLPKISGIDFIKKLHQTKPHIIITTAYPDYALEGFDLEVTDYLLKPVTRERFDKTISRLKKILHDNVMQNENQTLHSLLIKIDQHFIRLLHSQILFAEAAHTYVKIYTVTQVFVTHISLSELEKKVPENLFFRSHRSYLINTDKIISLKGNILKLGEYKVPVSRSQRSLLLKKISKSI